MDYCTLSYHRPEPLACQGEGRMRLDAWDGRRRLLGELVFQAPVELHFVEVEAARRSWLGQDRALYAVTVCNRSSLPLDRVTVAGGGAALPGTVRINGLPQPEADPALGVEVPGLDAGAEAVITWQGPLPGEGEGEPPMTAAYEYRFGGDTLRGEARA